MKTKKYKIKIPEGYVLVNETKTKIDGFMTITLGLEPLSTQKAIKKELPKTWEEYCELVSHPVIQNSWTYNGYYDNEFRALFKLLKLRDYYNSTEVESNPYSIYKVGNGFASTNNTINRGPIVLNSTKLGIEFVQNFRDLIIEALPLL